MKQKCWKKNKAIRLILRNVEQKCFAITSHRNMAIKEFPRSISIQRPAAVAWANSNDQTAKVRSVTWCFSKGSVPKILLKFSFFFFFFSEVFSHLPQNSRLSFYPLFFDWLALEKGVVDNARSLKPKAHVPRMRMTFDPQEDIESADNSIYSSY